MDELETKRAEARAQGYTDEQIDAYLNHTPVERQDQQKAEGPGMFRTPAVGGGGSPTGPVSPWGGTGEENKAVAQYAGAKALEYGTELYAGKKLVLDPVLRALGNRGAAGASGAGTGGVGTSAGSALEAGAPTTFSGGAPNAAAFDQAVSKPYMRPTVPGQPVVGAPQAAGIGQDLAGMAPRATGINAGQALGYSAVLPAALSMPYLGAAQEQAKIRQNPNAPEYANNPYAMVQRGQAPTQGAAGAMNQRTAVMNQQYGGLSQEDQDRLTQDRLSMAIRLKAAKKVLGQ